MNYDGKTYRNLEGQVAYLTEVAEALDNRITEVAAQIPSKMIVEELPEEGDPLITYYVGPKGTEPNLYYEVWVWVQEEPDGPFVWRELEDTDQVDLSGYLQKQTGTTTYAQAYIKNTDGTQGMFDVNTAAISYGIPRRNNVGQITLPVQANADPAEHEAISKSYGRNNFVAKQTGTTSQPQVYAKGTDGSQQMLDASVNADVLTIVRRTSTNQVRVATTPDGDGDATSKKYVDNNFLAKQTATSTYPQVYVKYSTGNQGMVNYHDTVVNGSLVLRTNTGQIPVPTTPTDNSHAASKAYVDAAVGQLLYLHDLELIITVDASNKLYVKAYLVNGSATAITSFDRQLYKRIDVQWGAFGTDIPNAVAVAVNKLPDTFRQDEFDEPFIGFLYQYFSGGNLVSGYADNSMSTTITDTVISW